MTSMAAHLMRRAGKGKHSRGNKATSFVARVIVCSLTILARGCGVERSKKASRGLGVILCSCASERIIVYLDSRVADCQARSELIYPEEDLHGLHVPRQHCPDVRPSLGSRRSLLNSLGMTMNKSNAGLVSPPLSHLDVDVSILSSTCAVVAARR